MNSVENELAKLQKRFQEAAKVIDDLAQIKQELDQLSIKYQDQLFKNSINLDQTQQQIKSLSNDYQEYKKYWNENFNVLIKKDQDILTKISETGNQTESEIEQNKTQLENLEKRLEETNVFLATFKNNVQLNQNLAIGSCLIGFIALILSIYSILFLPKNYPNTLDSPQESSPIIASPSPENSSIPVNYFREAVNKATRAATLAQSAKSKEEWNVVVNEWQSAIDMMKSTPSSDPNYEIAQKKVIEYQKNLNYAQQQTEE